MEVFLELVVIFAISVALVALVMATIVIAARGTRKRGDRRRWSAHAKSRETDDRMAA